MKAPITLEGKTVFVTGSAGFIGANLVKRLLAVKNIRIIGIDNMNDYYDVSLKEYRLQELEKRQLWWKEANTIHPWKYCRQGLH